MDFREQMDAIVTCNCRITVLYGEWAKAHGMSYHTMMVLDAIRTLGPCTQKQIVEEWMIPKQTVNTVVRDLFNKEYVVFSAGRNQKEKLISFTSQGEEMAARVLDKTMELEDRILKRIGAARCQVILDSMKQFADIFEEEVRSCGA